MNNERMTYRLIPIGQSRPQDVTVGIEQTGDGGLKAAVWWEAKGDVDADETEYLDVGEALSDAEAARALYGFNEVVVVLAQRELWDARWGDLHLSDVDKEPLGDLSTAALAPAEAFNLASSIEEERDA